MAITITTGRTAPIHGRAVGAATHSWVRSASGSVRFADVASVGDLLDRLDDLGVIQATVPSSGILRQPLAPMHAPRAFLDAAPPVSPRDGATRFFNAQVGARGGYLEGSNGHRLLSRSECDRVNWGIDALMAIADLSGISCHNSPALNHFVMVPETDAYLGTTNGRPNLGSCSVGIGLMFIRRSLSLAAGLVTAVHEAAHWLSAWRVHCPIEQGPCVYGLGFRMGKLFRGLYEGYTAKLTTRALAYARRNAELSKAAIQAHGGDEICWNDYADDCYATARQQLAATCARIYEHYTGQHVSAAQFVHYTDRPATTLRRLFDRAYFAGDLTIFGLLYRALGRDGFSELAAMGAD